jgi:proteasome accessory factor A
LNPALPAATASGLYYQLQRSGAVERTARDIDIFEAKTVPPALGRYRQAG